MGAFPTHIHGVRKLCRCAGPGAESLPALAGIDSARKSKTLTAEELERLLEVCCLLYPVLPREALILLFGSIGKPHFLCRQWFQYTPPNLPNRGCQGLRSRTLILLCAWNPMQVYHKWEFKQAAGIRL